MKLEKKYSNKDTRNVSLKIYVNIDTTSLDTVYAINGFKLRMY